MLLVMTERSMHDVPRVVVGDEEDGAAVGVDLVVLDARAAQGEGHGVAVVVDGAAAAAARGAGLRRVAAVRRWRGCGKRGC